MTNSDNSKAAQKVEPILRLFTAALDPDRSRMISIDETSLSGYIRDRSVLRLGHGSILPIGEMQQWSVKRRCRYSVEFGRDFSRETTMIPALITYRALEAILRLWTVIRITTQPTGKELQPPMQCVVFSLSCVRFPRFLTLAMRCCAACRLTASRSLTICGPYLLNYSSVP
jgi:hypothetical protein